MKCSRCQTKMKKGHLEKGLWIEGKPKYLGGKNVVTWPRTSEYCNAWLCPHCGKVELGIYDKLPKIFAPVAKENFQDTQPQMQPQMQQQLPDTWRAASREIVREQVVERAPTVIKEKVQMQPIVVKTESPKVEIKDNPSKKMNIVIVLTLALSMASTFLLVLTWMVVVLWNVMTNNLLYLIQG